MSAAPLGRAEYLKREELAAIATSAGAAALWGDNAPTSSQSSALVAEENASDEASRQLALLETARAVDVILVAGIWPDLEGETIAVPYDDVPLGLSGLIPFLVTASRISGGQTELTGQVQL